VLLEINRGVETLATWTEKVRHYLQLCAYRNLERAFQKPASGVRSSELREEAALGPQGGLPMNAKIFWFATLGDARGPGSLVNLAPPEGEERIPLIDTTLMTYCFNCGKLDIGQPLFCNRCGRIMT